MKLLWLCNVAPSVVQENMSGSSGGSGLWMDHVLEDLRKQTMTIRVLCPGARVSSGELDDNCSYATYVEGLPYRYLPELETQFRNEVAAFEPDVIHVWGTEYGHTLAMMNACESLNMLDRVVVSVQGLCSVIARHYAEGVPAMVQHSYTIRDFLRQDNISQQQRKFEARGELEIQALRKARHVIGRTDWDRACTRQINPDVQYHFCNETLREVFYQDKWSYSTCRKHRIFASSCSYPVKGFHYLLEAFAQIVKIYPDAILTVTGQSPLEMRGLKSKLRQGSYARYLAKLIRKYGLEDRVEFLGDLSAEQMRDAYLDANVFVLPSTIENSPNSLGEAMLLGVPCVASAVGGVSDMMSNRQEGYIYQPSAPYMLAYYIDQVFAMEEKAEIMGSAAYIRGSATHGPLKNLNDLLEIYRVIKETGKS